MRFDAKANSRKRQAISYRHDWLYHFKTDMPSDIRACASRGEVLKLLQIRTWLWRDIRKKIGTESMNSLFDGKTTIRELIDFKRNLTEEQAQDLRLASAFSAGM